MAQIEKMIAKTFMDIATGLETGSFGARPRIAVTGLGSEHMKNHFRRAFFRHALEDVKGIPGIFLLVIAIVVRVSCKYGL